MKFLKVFNESNKYNNREIDYDEYRNLGPLIPFNQDEYSKIVDFFNTTDIKFNLKSKMELSEGEIHGIQFGSKRFDISFYKMDDDWFILYVRHYMYEPNDTHYKCDMIDGCFEIIRRVLTPTDYTVKSFYEYNKYTDENILFKRIDPYEYNDIIEYNNIKFENKIEIDKIVDMITRFFVSDDETIYKVTHEISPNRIEFNIDSRNIIDEDEDFDEEEFDFYKDGDYDTMDVYIYKLEDEYYLISFDCSGFHQRHYFYKADTIDCIQQLIDNLNEII